MPPSGQQRFINGVLRFEVEPGTPAADPEALLERLHAIENAWGRVRDAANAARTLDLDILDVSGVVRAGAPTLPHPRLHLREFVLRPLRDVCPHWRHPVRRSSVSALLAGLPPADVRLVGLPAAH